MNTIIYKGKGITKLFPSGMYEFYDDSQRRFVKFDRLGDAKVALRKSSKPSSCTM